MKTFIRVDVGPDGFVSSTTLHDTVSTYSVLSVSYPKNFGEAISSVSIKFIRNTTTADDTILGPGKEIRIWHKSTSPVGNADADRVFRGYIIDKKLEGNEVIVTANDVFIKAQWTTGTTTQDYETSTSIKDILTALCTAAGLTASNNATAMSPTNIVKFYSNQQNVFERIQYLLNLTGWYGYYDPTTSATIIFQPKSAGGSQTFNVSNIIGVPQWTNDSRDLINDVTVISGSNQITTTYSTATTGGKSYTLGISNVAIENVIVSLNSDLSSPFASSEYVILGPSTPGIWFTKGGEPAAGKTIYINYTYQTSSGSSTASNATSQSNYVKRSKPIQKRDVLDSTDSGNWATNLVADGFWGLPIQEVTILVNDNVTIPALGSQADITDPITGRALTYLSHNTIVYSIELQWPYPGIRTFISSRPLKNPMQQTSVQDSVEKVQLELKKINPTSLMRKDASTPLLGSQDFCGYQGRNLRFENSSVAPSNLGLGGIYYNTGDHLLYYNKNSVWTSVGTVFNGGTITGDLNISKVSATLDIDSSSGSSLINLKLASVTKGQLYNTASDVTLLSNTGGLYLTTAITTGGSVFLGTKAVTRLTIADSLITSILPLRVDKADPSIEFYHSTVYKAQLLYYNTDTSFNIATDNGVNFYLAIDAIPRISVLDESDMTFHVKTGQKFTFTVG